MKPSWNDAPIWANWLVRDESGEWWWYEKEPKTRTSIHDLGEWFNAGAGRLAEASPHIEPWYESLEARP